jgi:hypothetical protein
MIRLMGFKSEGFEVRVDGVGAVDAAENGFGDSVVGNFGIFEDRFGNSVDGNSFGSEVVSVLVIVFVDLCCCCFRVGGAVSMAGHGTSRRCGWWSRV